jgi:hypothetical protein
MSILKELPDKIHQCECGNLSQFPTLEELRQLIKEVNELREENEDLKDICEDYENNS